MTGHDRLAFHASAPLIDAVHRAALRSGQTTAAFLRGAIADAVGYDGTATEAER